MTKSPADEGVIRQHGGPRNTGFEIPLETRSLIASNKVTK